MIRYNEPTYVDNAKEYVIDAINTRKTLSGDGHYTKKCHSLLENKFGVKKVLLTTSGTHALDMSAILSGIKPGDEVIMPSFTFSSTANAFVLRGARIKFIDVRKDTLNMDENLVEDAITKKTKVIAPVHYSGVACEMDTIQSIAEAYNLMVIEDSAQALMSKYKGSPLGTLSTFGCFSFHETKNYTSGEGGAIFINDERYIERAEIIREKGTDRTKVLRGEIDKYTWRDIGSSYLPSELNAAFLYAQLEEAEAINESRLMTWNLYYECLQDIKDKGFIDLPYIPNNCQHNAHLFCIRVKDMEERIELAGFLKQNAIQAIFHYIPLHSSKAGIKYGEFIGEDVYTTKESERLLRIPMYYGLKDNQVYYVCEKIKDFYKMK